MAGGIYGTGVSGLLSAKRSLAVASHNISNVNTEGYSRQRAELVAREPQRLGNSYVGTGVRVDEIKRLYDDFSALQIRNGEAGLKQAEIYHTLSSQVDNLIADPSAGLLPSMQEFFAAVQGVADAPASIPERQVLLSKAKGLESRFDALDQQFRFIGEDVNARIRSTVDEINAISASIASLNTQIVEATNSANAKPNDLLDKRETLINQLSEKTATRVVMQDDGQVNVSIGNGQPLVTAGESRKLVAARNLYDGSRLEVAYETPQGPMIVSSQMQGGILGGLIGFRQQVLDPSQNVLGKIAVGLAAEFNAQHRQGLDLNGRAGGDFFYALDNGTLPPTAEALPASTNQGVPPAVLTVAITDVGQLADSDYRFERKGGEYSLTRLSDGQVTRISGFPASPLSVAGIQVDLASGAVAEGDSFLLRPVKQGAANFQVLLNDSRKIAAAAPMRSEADIGNAGSGTIDAVTVTDPATFVAGSYTVVTAAATTAVADGVRATISDAGPVNNALNYRLQINGATIIDQNEVTAPLSSLTDLATAINAQQGTTGVRAYVDTAGGNLYLANDPANGQPIQIDESLTDLGGTPLDAADAVQGYFGGNLTGAAPTAQLIVPASPDAYVAVDGAGGVVGSGSFSPGSSLTVQGMSFNISGSPLVGDRFSLASNTGGVSDNRNALQLAAIEINRIFDAGSSGLRDVYSKIVADVGNRTAQASISWDAQESLLEGALSRREEVSGVNLDEEAADIIRFQQAYQASARVINSANTLFDTLMGIFR